MQVLPGNGGSVEGLVLIAADEPVLVVLDPEFDPALSHEHLFIGLFDAGAANIVTQLIEIIATAQDGGVDLPYIAHDVCGSIIGVNADRTFLQVEAGELPDILLHPAIHLRRQEVFEGGGTKRADLYSGLDDPPAELGPVDT